MIDDVLLRQVSAAAQKCIPNYVKMSVDDGIIWEREDLSALLIAYC